MDQNNDDGGPFLPTSVNSHPQFTPIKLGTQAINAKLLKPPKPPEKPLMPYMRYSRKIWDSVKALHKESKLWEIGRIIGQMWRELVPSEKQKFIDEYETEKVDYTEALKTYQNSPAYQQYLAAKEKAAMQQRQAVEDRDTIKASRSQSMVGNVSSSNAGIRQPKFESRLGMPPVDSDVDDLDYWPLRKLAAARYHRNQKLLFEIFNEACVPDLRGIVTFPRMQMLKRQVHSLSMHQKKLENELEQLEESFTAKKRCLEQSHQDFLQEMEQYCVPAADAAKYQSMVADASSKLLEEYDLYKRRMEDEEKKNNSDDLNDKQDTETPSIKSEEPDDDSQESRVENAGNPTS